MDINMHFVSCLFKKAVSVPRIATANSRGRRREVIRFFRMNSTFQQNFICLTSPRISHSSHLSQYDNQPEQNKILKKSQNSDWCSSHHVTIHATRTPPVFLVQKCPYYAILHISFEYVDLGSFA